MNIWLVQSGEELPVKPGVRKLRTALMAEELTARGHSVVWWASAFDHFSKSWYFDSDKEIDIDGAGRIIALKGCGYSDNVSLKRFYDHRLIASKFRRAACGQPPPDMLVVSMPPHDLAFEAVAYAKKAGVPAIVDIRDPWPDIIRDLAPWYLKWAVSAALYRDFSMIKSLMRDASAITSVTGPMLKWGLAYAGREQAQRDGVYYLGYRKSDEQEIAAAESRMEETISRMRGRFVVLFVGTFATFHSPAALLDAAAALKGMDMMFVLAGSGGLFDSMKKRAEGMDNVILTGWLGQSEMDALVRHSHVGVCPCPRKADLFPNKAFVYMSGGLPVISAFEGDLHEIIRSQRIGMNYDYANPSELKDRVMSLYEDRALYAEMSCNSLRFFDSMGDAGMIISRYIENMEAIAGSRRK